MKRVSDSEDGYRWGIRVRLNTVNFTNNGQVADFRIKRYEVRSKDDWKRLKVLGSHRGAISRYLRMSAGTPIFIFLRLIWRLAVMAILWGPRAAFWRRLTLIRMHTKKGAIGVNHNCKPKK